jgi:Tfp pilus assembly protein PilE
MKKALSTNSGITILELMTAIFIFSIASYSILHGLRAGDKIGGRAKISAAAATLASNEAERIRHAALNGIQSPDVSYTETVSGVRYTIYRKAITAPGTGFESKTFTEFEIRVEAPRASYIFKLIQGYHQ